MFRGERAQTESEAERISPMPYGEHRAKPRTELSLSKSKPRHLIVKSFFYPSAHLVDLPIVLSSPAGIQAKTLFSVA